MPTSRPCGASSSVATRSTVGPVRSWQSGWRQDSLPRLPARRATAVPKGSWRRLSRPRADAAPESFGGSEWWCRVTAADRPDILLTLQGSGACIPNLQAQRISNQVRGGRAMSYVGSPGGVQGYVGKGSGPRAGFWTRFFAAVVDWVILAVVNTIIEIVLKGGAGLAVAILVAISYYTVLDGGPRGQTVGKMALGIR